MQHQLGEPLHITTDRRAQIANDFSAALSKVVGTMQSRFTTHHMVKMGG